MKNKLFAKIMAGLLAILMVVGLLPLIASAEETTGDVIPLSNIEADPEASLDNLHLNKTAVLQNDGTWTITLEAYATGKVESTVKVQVVPTDVILVLDQSGSMTDEKYYIDIPSGTYSAAGSVTNAQLASGDTTYYFYDENDQKYYPVTTTKQMVSHDTWWVDSADLANGTVTKIILESENEALDSNNKMVATSWTAGSTTVNFSDGTGYLLTDYIIYQMSGSNKNYSYTRIAYGRGYDTAPGVETPVTEQKNRQSANTALQTYVSDLNLGLSVTTTSIGNNNGNNGNNNYYAIAYTPVELYDNDVFYYTYSYVDDMGQTWIIGHSAQDNGSMDNVENEAYDSSLGALYVEKTTRGPRLTALKNAATTFINDMQAASAAHQVDHRIAVVGFSGDDTDRSGDNEQYEKINSELFIGATQYNFYDSTTSDYYDDAFQSVNTTAGYNNLIASIGALEGSGPTYASVGFLLAQSVAKANANATETTNDYISGKRKLVVVFMTDGEPGWSGYNDGGAAENTAINVSDSNTIIEGTGGLAAELESTYNATIYTVALLDAAPTNADVISFLSNSATSGTYTLTTTGVGLTNFFQSIETSVDTTTKLVDLTSDAFMVDRVSEYFNMPAGLLPKGEDETTEAYQARVAAYLQSHVTIQKAKHLGNHEFAAAETLTADQIGYDTSVSDTEYAGKVHVWPTFSETDGLVHGITVHNWNYISDENLVTTKYVDSTDEMEATGYKLIVTINGVTAKDTAAQGVFVNTNDDHSGIWDTVKGDTTTYGKLKAFPMPKVDIPNRSYVLDYAKQALLDTDSSIRQALHLDSATDGVFSPFATADIALNTTDENAAVQYGDVSISGNKVYYTPKTTNWNGYDTFYVFWTSQTDGEHTGIGDAVTGNGWSKVNVIPANNVYYEDTFVDNDSTGTVGIVYTGTWFTDTSNDTYGNNVENPENLENEQYENQGWVDSLADDDKYSDGSAHGANFAVDANGQATATASFTFTGTGMDIYSRTNSTTGTIFVKVEPDAATKAKGVNTKYFIVDNLAASGDYYQIPVISYQAVKKTTNADGTVTEETIHGTYTVTITVTGGAATEEYGNRKTFYLDGIRVYNPLANDQENDPIVDTAYGTEVDAVFTEIRDILLDANTFNEQTPSAAGAVFIDQINEGDLDTDTSTEEGTSTITSVIGTYEEFGPKNEVYLKQNQSIVFIVNGTSTAEYYVGLKSIEGTSALASNGESNSAITISHSTDLYYKVVPTVVDGKSYIQITNSGEGILSVTKLKMTNSGNEAPDLQTADVQAISADEALSFASTFAAMPVAAYSVETDEPEVEDTTTEVEVPETPDVEITIPEQPSLEDQLREQLEKLVADLFGSIRNWFNI